MSKAEHEVLSAQFSALVSELESHEARAVSVFDHWLTEREALRELDDVSGPVQQERDARLHQFALELTAQFNGFLVKFVGRYKQRITFRKFANDQGRVKSVKPLPYKYGDTHRFIVVLPDLDAVYVEGSDFTHHIFGQENNYLNAVQQVAQGTGLHVL